MLEARDIFYRFTTDRMLIEGISARIQPGQVLGLGGPSGCGKSTFGKLLAGYLRPHAGQILLNGAPLSRTGRKPIQYLSQTPIETMNPRWRIGRIIAEGRRPSSELTERIGIEAGWLSRYPHELSGGQLQRVALLRAMAIMPRFLIADEVTAPLDACTQASIWRLMLDMTTSAGIGILAISHDGALLDRVAHSRIAFG